MKRVGLGLEITSPRIKTYFDHLDRAGKAPAQSLIRWWFAYNPATINASAANDLFELPESVVAVMSEQQWVNAQGDRQATGANDPAADAFAAEMTAKFRELCATEPAYARLEGIFELDWLCRFRSKLPSSLRWLNGSPIWRTVRAVLRPKGKPPRASTALPLGTGLKNGTVVAVISGGVKIEPAAVAGRANWQTSHVERPAALAPTTSSTASATEWWRD